MSNLRDGRNAISSGRLVRETAKGHVNDISSRVPDYLPARPQQVDGCRIEVIRGRRTEADLGGRAGVWPSPLNKTRALVSGVHSERPLSMCAILMHSTTLNSEIGSGSGYTSIFKRLHSLSWALPGFCESAQRCPGNPDQQQNLPSQFSRRISLDGRDSGGDLLALSSSSRTAWTNQLRCSLPMESNDPRSPMCARVARSCHIWSKLYEM